MTLLTGKDVDLFRGIFLMGEISKFLAVGWDSPPHSQGFPQRFGGERDSPHLVGATKEHRRRGQSSNALTRIYISEIFRVLPILKN